MAIDLSDFDVEEVEGQVAHLTDELDWRDLQESQDCLITVQYNEIDLGRTPYHFNQPFEGNEANLYFQRMKEFSELTVNYIVDHSDYKAHFNRTDIRGNLKMLFDSINPNIAKANPLIFHFALDPESTVTNASRATGVRNPRVYFMIGYNGMIHILFFDPFHELNPIKQVLLNAIFAADNIKTGRNMVKQYQRKRTKEELISGFKQAIAKKKEWLEAHHLEELKVAEV